MLNKFNIEKNRFKKDRSGFAITFEVGMTMLLFALVIYTTIFLVQCFQIQKYFAEVTSSTCTMASRYGGNNSNAYKMQMTLSGSGTRTISENANSQLAYFVSKTNKIDNQPEYITVSDAPNSNNEIIVELDYNYSQVSTSIGSFVRILLPNGGHVHQKIVLPSIMQNGKLLTIS